MLMTQLFLWSLLNIVRLVEINKLFHWCARFATTVRGLLYWALICGLIVHHQNWWSRLRNYNRRLPSSCWHQHYWCRRLDWFLHPRFYYSLRDLLNYRLNFFLLLWFPSSLFFNHFPELVLVKIGVFICLWSWLLLYRLLHTTYHHIYILLIWNVLMLSSPIILWRIILLLLHHHHNI